MLKGLHKTREHSECYGESEEEIAEYLFIALLLICWNLNHCEAYGICVLLKQH